MDIRAHYGGSIPLIALSGQFRFSPSTGLIIDNLSGNMNVRSVLVDYFSPLPAVAINAADIKFDESKIYYSRRRCSANGLNIRDGTIVLSGLDEYDQFADINLLLDGPVAAQLDFINRKPLNFASAMGVDPDKTSGHASTRVNLYFILEKRSRVERHSSDG